MKNELVINGELVDLPNDSVLALTFQIATLNELKSLNGTISNKIVLPPTKNNLRILGFVGDMNIDYSQTVRKKNTCTYRQDGIEIVPMGSVAIGNVSAKGIAITVTAGNIDFFDVIDGSLQDLDMSAYDHQFGSGDIPNSRLNRSGYIYPLINYGDLSNASDRVQMSRMRPATFAKTLVEEIVKQSGFTLIDGIAAHPKAADHYNRMILPFSNDAFEHGKRVVDLVINKRLSAKQTANVIYINPNTSDPAAYSQLSFNSSIDPSSLFDGEKYVATESMIADIDFFVPKIIGHFTSALSFKYAWNLIEVIKSGVVIATVSVTVPGASGSGQTFILNNSRIVLSKIAIAPGDEIYIRINYHQIEFGSGFWVSDVQLLSEYTFNITPVVSDVLYGDTVQLEATLPDISQKDFLKSMANFFGALVQTDSLSKTVTINPFMVIPESKHRAKNWTGKVVNKSSATSEIYIGDYAKNNIASYKNEDSIYPADYGSYNMKVADENLVLNKELFALPFSASVDTTVIGGLSCVLIKKIPLVDGNEFTESTDPRICMVTFVEGTNLKYTHELFTVDINDSVPLTYFNGTDILQSRDMMLETFFKLYYVQLESLVNDQRKKSVPLLLTARDMAEFDFFTPVFLEQYGCYFYVSKIPNYVSGNRPTTIDLIKL